MSPTPPITRHLSEPEMIICRQCGEAIGNTAIDKVKHYRITHGHTYTYAIEMSNAEHAAGPSGTP